MAESGRTLLKTMGEQVTYLFGTAPRSHTSIDEGGWLGLSGEPLADLNMACVFSGPNSGVQLDEYVGAANRAEVPVIVMLEESSDELLAEAARLGATHVGNIPIMSWQDGSIPELTSDGEARIAVEDVERTAAIQAMAEAFSLDLAMCKVVMQPILESHDVTCWICDRGDVVAGAGIGIRSEDIVGVYCMATKERFQRRGIGKTILTSMMSNYLGEGVTSFCLGTSPAGFRLYEQLGYATIANPAAVVVGTSTQFH